MFLEYKMAVSQHSRCREGGRLWFALRVSKVRLPFVFAAGDANFRTVKGANFTHTRAAHHSAQRPGESESRDSSLESAVLLGGIIL